MISFNYKQILFCISFVFILIVISLLNKLYVNEYDREANKYKNEVANKINSNDFSGINYDYLLSDINALDMRIRNSFNENADIINKTDYYLNASNIYDNKINEIVSVLNEILDDEDFQILQSDMDEFYNNIDFAREDMSKKIKSSIEFNYNINKYIYEEKKLKCFDLLENYKGFLN